MRDEKYARDKRITLVYKSEIDPTAFETVAMVSRTIDDFEIISSSMERGIGKDVNVYLHRREGDRMVCIGVPMIRNFGGEHKKVLHRLVGVSYLPELWFDGVR